MKATAASDKNNTINRLVLGMGIAYSIFLVWADYNARQSRLKELRQMLGTEDWE